MKNAGGDGPGKRRQVFENEEDRASGRLQTPVGGPIFLIFSVGGSAPLPLFPAAENDEQRGAPKEHEPIRKRAQRYAGR